MFTVTLTNVLITLFYMIPGFILRKLRLAREEHLPTMSAILLYVCTPFLVVNSFMRLDFSPHQLLLMVGFFFLALAVQIVFMGLIALFIRKRYSDIRFRLFTFSSVIGNVGFFGYPIITAIMPDSHEVAAYCVTFILAMNVLTFTVGIFALTHEKRYVSLRGALLNPATLGLVFALPIYLFGLRSVMPSVLAGAIESVASLSTPLCMFILGIRLASVPLRRILSCRTAIFTAVFKLVVYPLFCLALISLIPVPSSFSSALVILAGTPCATAILGLAEIHDAEPSMAANCVFLSTLCCFITIPLLTLLL